MAGAIFVISRRFAEHWRLARTFRFWESRRRVDVADGDLLAFWVGGQGLAGLCVMRGPRELVADIRDVRPWLPDDQETYTWRYRFEVLLDHGLPRWSWRELMTIVGQPNRGANTAPVWVEDDRAAALAATLGVEHAESPSALERLLDAHLVAAEPVGPGDFVYVPEPEDVVTKARRPPLIDTDAYDRGLTAHARTQNAAAAWLQAHDALLLAPRLGVNSDLLWRRGEDDFVGEVKSLHNLNEREQLRLGLGQVLEFAFRLDAKPVLIVEQQPAAEFWDSLCARQGVRLVWPEVFERLQDPLGPGTAT